MIPELDPEHGLLPAGRYRSTRDEIHARFVDGRDQRRAELWRHWELATTLLGHHVPINAAWLHGTFFSDSIEPQPVQSLYWAEDLELGKARLDPISGPLLGAFAMPGEVRRIVGVQVDTQLAQWHCQPDPQDSDDYYAPYLHRRGMLDDLLQRVASGPAGAARTRLDALPRRGYLEVIIDGYS
ncbi:hypothetical protein P5V93_15035 [Mycobacteroides abscessus subsp. abscessus]|uniref:DUF6932 family protein n=1 Tax=Mycobacteroides abscessus TaxID=36809 RepID=UPI0009278F2D|nr:hypothetical protein [Mycobacteroides abscessus]AWG52263.1 hypothetical protein DDT48_24750 [Mycobacteroides abscessus]MBN7551748.1 hypothetical protein [Mycobacteroides abscessus subsp. abscessus]MDO3099776.1 hypothetical protein [Mycobacteroides abscessus subsp. abscessus]MDO3187552.1 hypothetical protein [Mycobacteroides abscessus subsp. abscessus]MDO3192404.1 hypothetical protein [Mycobacteroides abscessus subsp. abscessus]